MSMTIAIGIVGPSYWSYMATVMAIHLQKIVKGKASPIPRGIHQEAERLFDIALDCAGGKLAKNPPASLHAYVMIWDIFRDIGELFTTTDEVEAEMMRCRAFIDGLHQIHELSPEEVAIGQKLIRFFFRLKEKGEAETYKRVMCGEEEG